MTTPLLKPSDLWCTPPWLLDLVREVDEIALDPCPGPKGWTGARSELRLDEGNDGLTTDWFSLWSEDLGGKGLTFVNAPYGRGHPPMWAAKVAQEAQRGVPEGMEIIGLFRGNLGTAWWQDFMAPHLDAFCILRGRVEFFDHATLQSTGEGGKFDSVVVYFGDRARRFKRAFGPRGWCP